MFRKPNHHGARLSVSRLEDRTVPSTLVWVGDVNGQWGANVGGNTNWFNSSTSTDNVLPQNGDDLQFLATGANHTNTNDLGNLTPTSISLSGTDYVIGGNSITTNALADISSSGANIVSLPIALTSALPVSVTDASTRLTLSGVISGSAGLTMAGSGTLQMSGSAANTYSGMTTVSAGMLELNKSGATAIAGTLNITGGVARELASNQISDTAILNVNSGTTFDLNNLADVIRVVNVVGGSVSIGTGELDATNVGMTGGSIASTGSGSLVLFGDLATSSAPTAATISGNLNLGGFFRTFTIADGAAAVDLDLSAVVSSSLSEGLTKAGAGTLRLDGLNSNTYPGLTIVSFGTLELAKANGAIATFGDIEVDNGVVRELGPDQIGDNADVSIFSGATFDLGNFTDVIGGLAETGATVRIGTGTLTAGPVTMAGGIISSTGAGKLVLNGDVVNNSGFSTIAGSLDLGGATRTFDVAGGTLAISASIGGSGSAGFGKLGAGNLVFSGSLSNTYSGLTSVAGTGTLELERQGGATAILGDVVVNGGIVLVDFASELPPTSAVTVNGAGVFRLNTPTVVIGALTANGGANVALNGNTLTAGPVTLINGYINFSTNNGNLVLSGDLISGAASTTSVVFTNLNLGGAARTIDVADGVAPVDMEIQGTISGTGGITKTGAGTLRVLEASYTGLTTVNAGTLLLLDGGGGLSAVPGNLTVNGGTVRAMSNNQIANTALVTVNSGGTLDLNGLTDTIGPMIVAGGTLTTGGTTAGRLTVGNTSFNSGSTLAMNLVSPGGSDRLIVNGTVALGGALRLTSTSSFTVGQTVTLIDNDGSDAVTGAFANLPQGATVSASGQLFTISYNGGTGNDVVLTRIVTPPLVTGTQVNDGSTQRSRVTSLQITFNTQVTFASTVQNAFTLTRTGGGSVSFQASASVVGGVTVATLSNFTGAETDGFGSLNDGRYTLTALASQISANGMQLNNGTNYTFNDTQGLFRMFGDVNGDQTVNGFDLGFFRNAFGTQTGDSNYLSYLDLNGDGVINGFDLGQFRTRFGTMLP